MLWLIITILAYFILALVALGDKFLLAGPPNPKIYSFYVGILGILALVLIPFVGFSIPDIGTILLSFLAGAIFVLALFGLFQGLEHFEASRIVPAIGGLVPLFTFGLVYFFARGSLVLSAWQVLSFALLLFGSVLIAFKTKKAFFSQSLKISAIAALLFALAFVLAKQVYLLLPFWTGFIWMRIGGFLAALGFLATKEVKQEIFTRQRTFEKKTGGLFIIIQALGGGAAILQNWAIALVPLSLLAFVNALEGTKYVFLFFLASLVSFKFPKLLEEKIEGKILVQKIAAILLIALGLTILALIGT